MHNIFLYGATLMFGLETIARIIMQAKGIDSIPLTWYGTLAALYWFVFGVVVCVRRAR